MRKEWLMLLLTIPLLAQSPAAKTGLKLSDFRVHDPCILADQASRTYYLYTAIGAKATGQNRAGVVTYKSKDLSSWEGPHIVFTVPDGLWADPAHGVWAPEVHAYRGKYYLFATLLNNDQIIDKPPASWRNTTRRATQIFVSDSPEGAFVRLGDKPVAPEDFMTLDGTLFVEDGVPYMVYAHEWVQLIDGTMEAIPLREDLSAAAGEPFYLFKASDAPWLLDNQRVSKEPRHYVTDGPYFHRTRNGKLVMIWSSWKSDPSEAKRLKVPPQRQTVYMETLAYSLSGKLRGPWRQAEPLLSDDTGHGMIFRTFDNRLMMVAHQPTMSPDSRARLVELEDTGDSIRVKR